MLEEPRKFYKPGELTTWFKRLFTPPTSIPPEVDLDERRAVLAELAQAGARWDAASSRYQHAIDTTRRIVEEARDILRLAEAASAAAQGAMMAASGSHDVQVGRLKRRLQAGASAHIAVFVSDVFDQIEVLRARGVDVHESEGPPDINDRRQRRVASNADSVRVRMAALVAAKSAAEALAFEALSDEEVVARLTTLRDGIPDVQPLMIEAGSVFTPYELRAAEWRAGRPSDEDHTRGTTGVRAAGYARARVTGRLVTARTTRATRALATQGSRRSDGRRSLRSPLPAFVV